MNNNHFKISNIKQVNWTKQEQRNSKIFGELNSYFLWSNGSNIVNDETSDIHFTGKNTIWANIRQLCRSNFYSTK